MSKQTNRRGFTITELVIVIVVIAILAAVLIPTFVSLINKANQSADIQAARQMNMALQSASAVEEPETFEEVIDILAEAGYDAEGSLKPITANHQFYWYSTYNTIVLANEEDAANPVVVYPEDNKDLVATFAADLPKTEAQQVLFDLEKGFLQYVEIEVNTAEGAVAALDKGQSITLTADTTATKPISIPAGAETTLDLGGKTLSTPKNQSSGRSDYLDVYGTLVIENGTFNGRGIQVRPGGKLVITKDANITVNSVDANGGAAIWVYEGGEVVVEGGKFVATDAGSATAGAAALINDGGNVTINGGEFIGKSGAYPVQNWAGTMTINGATITGARGGLAVSGGSATLNGGSVTNGKNDAYAVYMSGGSLTWKGGTLQSAGKAVCVESGTFTNNSGVALVKDGNYYTFK